MSELFLVPFFTSGYYCRFIKVYSPYIDAQYHLVLRGEKVYK